VGADWAVSRSPGNEAEHVASWHPGVALAVADWLDVKAANLERVEVLGYRDHDHGYALAVARAYMSGETR
jgi:hypothetical protein